MKNRFRLIILQIIKRRLIPLILIIIIIFLGKSVWNIGKKDFDARTKRDEAQDRLGEINERRARLEGTLSQLRTKRGVEEELRDKFPVASEGESIIVLVDEDEKEIDENESNDTSFWSKIIRFFKRD